MKASDLFVALFTTVSINYIASAEDAKRPAVSRDDYVVTESTKIDFEGAMVDGKMKAPTGFFLQGRNAQSLSQMVKLRSDFKRELKGSRDSVRALVR